MEKMKRLLVHVTKKLRLPDVIPIESQNSSSFCIKISTDVCALDGGEGDEDGSSNLRITMNMKQILMKSKFQTMKMFQKIMLKKAKKKTLLMKEKKKN